MVEAAAGVRPFARPVVHVGEVRRRRRQDGQVDRQPGAGRDLLDRFGGSAVRLGLLHRR